MRWKLIELIVCMFILAILVASLANSYSIALANNQIQLVQLSILGSILVNLLLILGSALLASMVSQNDPTQTTSETQLLACLLFVSVFVIIMPVGYCF